MPKPLEAKMLFLAIVITLLAAVFFVYTAAIRPWHLQWGASHLDRVAQLPGDELSPHAPSHITHAIAIDAPPEAVWPALETAVQHFVSRSGMVVSVENPPQAVALISPADVSRVQAGDEALQPVQAFFLKAQPGGKTRLIARRRSKGFPTIASQATDFFLRELSDFIAERKMLLAIKAQSEKSG